MKKELENENVIIIEDWMVSKLKLKGNDLIMFAIIHGASRNGERFCGSISHLEALTGASRNTVISSLKKLVDLKLVSKNTILGNGNTIVEYKSKFLTSSDNHVKKENIGKGSHEILIRLNVEI